MKKTNYLAYFFHATWRIVETELALFRRFPRLKFAVVAIVIVPAAYALIYLTSVWDPNAKTSDLPVGIVNLDEGFVYQEHPTNVGAELTAELIRSGTFGFRPVSDAQLARQAVRLGELAFAVIIPKNFSANAVPGMEPGAGKVTVVLSEGNNYASAGFARRFAADLGHQVNEALNEKRWEQVLLSADGSGKNLEKLKAGMTQLRLGAMALNDGVGRYSGAAMQLANGFKQMGAGIREMEDRLPADADLKRLKSSTQKLALRQRDLGAGLEQLQTGARKLTQGITLMQEQTAGLPFLGERIAAGSSELVAGGTQLTEGLATALDASARLSRGASKIEAGTEKLVDGITAFGEGIHLMAEKLPEDTRFETFHKSGDELLKGAGQLRAGIDMVDSVLPASLGKFDGSARGLADSVEPTLDVLAPVANNGSAFAPNMVAMALWLGAVMAVYLFNMRLLLVEHAHAPALAKALGKFAVPALIVLLQTGLTFLMLVFWLGVAVPNPLSFVVSMIGAALTFLAVVYLLLRAFGDAGKLIAVLLLTLQLAAGGGVMPIELSGDFFQAVHDWLPFTWVIKTFRASLFGAFDNGWLNAYAIVLVSGIGSLLLSGLVCRWNVVELANYKPGIDT